MATVEYAALAVLVSLVLGVAGTAVGAERIPLAVAGQLGRALCLVQGGDCLGRDGPRPCVVREEERSRRTDVSVLALRLADGRTVLREQRSDGTVAVTVSLVAEAGGAVVAGGRLRTGGREAGAAAEATARASVRFGRRFVVADGAVADRLIRRLAAEDPPAGGAAIGAARFLLGRGDPADERSVTLEDRAEAVATLGALGIKARAERLASVAGGVRVARRTGERTVVVRVEGGLAAALGAPLGLGAAAERGRDLTVEATFDRRGAPVALTVAGTRMLGASAALDRVGAAQARMRIDTEARLDLADPTARALASGLLDRLGSLDGEALATARALGERMAATARIDRRRYATTHAERTKGHRLAFFGELGAEVVHATDTARLVDAIGYEPGLGWTRRLDCVGPA
jgi:hypothetical protein